MLGLNSWSEGSFLTSNVIFSQFPQTRMDIRFPSAFLFLFLQQTNSINVRELNLTKAKYSRLYGVINFKLWISLIFPRGERNNLFSPLVKRKPNKTLALTVNSNSRAPRGQNNRCLDQAPPERVFPLKFTPFAPSLFFLGHHPLPN